VVTEEISAIHVFPARSPSPSAHES